MTLRQLTDALTVRDRVLQEKTNRLRESEAMFRAIFYMVPSPMAITSAENGTFEKVNNSFCHTVGYTENELIGQQTTMLYPAVDRDRVYAALKETGVANIATTCTRKDGTTLDVLMTVTALTMNDLGILLTIATKYEPIC